MNKQSPSKGFREDIKLITYLRNKNIINDEDLKQMFTYTFNSFAQNQVSYTFDKRMDKLAAKLCRGLI